MRPEENLCMNNVVARGRLKVGLCYGIQKKSERIIAMEIFSYLCSSENQRETARNNACGHKGQKTSLLQKRIDIASFL
jgi:hypothetical protein